MSDRRHRALAAFLALAAGFVLGLSAVVIFIDPIARLLTRVTIAHVDGFSGTFSDARFSLLRMRYEVDDLQLFEPRSSGNTSPSFSAKSIEVHLSGRDLLGGRLVSWVEIRQAKATLDLTSQPWASRWDRLLAQLPEMRVVRLVLLDSEAVVLDRSRHSAVDLRDLHLSIENVATRRNLVARQPSILSATASVERSGKVELIMTADLRDELLSFAGNARLRSLDLGRLRGLLVATHDRALPSGEFDLDVAFACKRGRLQGGVKTIFRSVGSVDRPLGQELGRQLRAAAGAVPFYVDLSPHVRVGPLLLSLLHHAVHHAVSEGLARRTRQPALRHERRQSASH